MIKKLKMFVIFTMITCTLGIKQGFSADISNLINVKDYEIVDFDKNFRRLTTKSVYPDKNDLEDIYSCGDGYIVLVGSQGVSIYKIDHNNFSEIFKDYEYVSNKMYPDHRYFDKFSVGPDCIASGKDFVIMSSRFVESPTPAGTSGVIVFQKGKFQTYPALVTINLTDTGKQNPKIICFLASCRISLESLNAPILKVTHPDNSYNFVQEYNYNNDYGGNFVSYHKRSEKPNSRNTFCLNFDKTFSSWNINGVLCDSIKRPTAFPFPSDFFYEPYLGSFGYVYNDIPKENHYTYCALNIKCKSIKLENSKSIYPKILYKSSDRWFLRASNFLPKMIGEDINLIKSNSPHKKDIVNVFCDLGQLNSKKCYRFVSKRDYAVHAFIRNGKWFVISVPLDDKNNDVHINMKM